MNKTQDAPESDDPYPRLPPPAVTVREGKVNRKQAHIAFCAGQTVGEENTGVEVALLAPADIENPEAGQFVLEWVLSEAHPQAAAWRKVVLQEVNFYLIEKQEERPWGYALYHCGTTSNAYAYMGGGVHFCHMPGTDP